MSQTTTTSNLRFHGGQSWSQLCNFVEDFSVTTNAIGTCESGVNAMTSAIHHVAHYPPSSQEPTLSHMAEFIWPQCTPEVLAKNKSRLTLGNGSSELIDIVTRVIASKGAKTFRPGPTRVQYMDYQRTSMTYDLEVNQRTDDKADYLAIVNPTNPTGDWMAVDALKSYINEHAKNNSFVVVDESMLFWYGNDWREQSLTNEKTWIEDMLLKRQIAVFVIHSWTKIWNCCGVRIGSVIAPTVEFAKQIQSLQSPWSVNSLALAFASAACQDSEYLEQTWKCTKLWRRLFVDQLKKIAPKWDICGADFTSWIWVDTHDETLAERIFGVCEKSGVPIRWAKYGYKQPTCLRFGVRKPQSQLVLFEALQSCLQVSGADIKSALASMSIDDDAVAVAMEEDTKIVVDASAHRSNDSGTDDE